MQKVSARPGRYQHDPVLAMHWCSFLEWQRRVCALCSSDTVQVHQCFKHSRLDDTGVRRKFLHIRHSSRNCEDYYVPKGLFLSTYSQNSACTACAAGSYSAFAVSSGVNVVTNSPVLQCVTCSAGTFGSARGSTTCISCPVWCLYKQIECNNLPFMHSWIIQHWGELYRVKDALRVPFSTGVGMGRCMDCPSGQFTNAAGRTICEALWFRAS